jgi:hypothetical protein
MPNVYQPRESTPVRPPVVSQGDGLRLPEARVVNSRPQEEVFIGKPYSMAEVQADLRTVAGLEARMTREKEKQEGVLLEQIVEGGINKHGWLGPYAVLNPTAKFDDIVNGVDGVVEFHSGPDKNNSMWALAVDITENSGQISGKGIREKLANIQAGLDSGEMGKVKYFRPNRPGLQMKGEWRGLPKMLLVGSGNLEELQRLQKHQEQASGALERDPVAMDFLIQLRIQAQVYANYAQSQGKERTQKMFLNIDRELKRIFDSKFPGSVFTSADFAKNPNDLVLLKALGELGFNVKKVRI